MKTAPQIVPPEACQSMEDVRLGIDTLDRELVAMLAVRQRYIEAAGRIKPNKDEVRLPWRIEDVVTKILAEAEKQGLSKRIAEPVWRIMIDRCIDHEHEIWDKEH
ncbi:chorismate mutase [Hyphococcus lacteus]|uniref:chorismate mutase n=1 Tax=Hyphococcus lacteus TaxID=3143536 RepID=A0ABV3Z3L0_9PROT